MLGVGCVGTLVDRWVAGGRGRGGSKVDEGISEDDYMAAKYGAGGGSEADDGRFVYAIRNKGIIICQRRECRLGPGDFVRREQVCMY